MATHVKVDPGQADTSRNMSDALWGDCDWDRMLKNFGYGWHWKDDFLDAIPDVTTAERHGGYLWLDTGDSTITPGAVIGGVLQLLTTTDNEDVGLQLGSGAPFVIPANSTTGTRLWWEVRLKKSIITADKAGFFVGLAGEGALAANFIADAGDDFADEDLIGWWNLEGEATLDAICQKTGAAFDTIHDAPTLATLVADTYIKLGMTYNPDGLSNRKVIFWVNGVPIGGDSVGEASGDATVYLQDTTNFPGGEEMSPIIYQSAASGDDVTLSIDWIAYGQRAY